jgi:hypothetical protein
MSYELENSLNDLDVAEPLNGATPAELLLAFRQLKAVVKNMMLISHHPDGRIRAGSISGLDPNTVGTEEIANNAVTADKLADASVATDRLIDESVTVDKLADGSVTETKYADESIPATAYQANTIPLNALAGYITREYLSSDDTDDAVRAVTEEAIADLAVVDRAIKDVAIGKLTGGADSQFLFNVGGVWSAITASGGLSYDAGLGQFLVSSGVKVATVVDAKTRGVDGGAGVTNTWSLRSLGELTDTENLLTFSANKFKLLVGKYFFYIECPAYNVGLHQARLFDVTNSTAALWGSSAGSPAAGNNASKSVLIGFVDVTDANTEYQVEHWIGTSVGATDFGKAASSDNTTPYANHREVYTQGFVVKIS